MNWTKFKAYLKWTVAVSCYWWLAFNGTIGHSESAWNIWRFLCWLNLVLTSFVFCLPDSKKKTRNINARINVTSDLIGAVLLAMLGHFVYAGLTMFQSMMHQACYKEES